MSILQGILVSLALACYFGVETRGMVFSGTDERPSRAVRSGGSRGGGGGVFFWGTGYRGGK